jgi:Tfp pilus assembly protein PilX
MKQHRPVRIERGFVMVIALIMLLAVTLMVVSSSNVVQANLKVVQNAESREQARLAALAAIEEAISSDRFTTSPEAMFVESCEVNNQKCYDSNGDGSVDIRVLVQEPTCAVVTPTRNSELDVFGDRAQATCFLPPGVYSLCANSVWEFQATATDLVTGAEVSVRQGVSILTSINRIETACPT